MPGLHLVAVDRLAAELAVDLVQVQAVRTGDERLGLKDVGTQLPDVAGFARVVARGLDAARKVAAPVSKPVTSSACQQWSESEMF